MNQKTLSLWLKLVLAGAAVCLLVIFVWVLPRGGSELVEQHPVFAEYGGAWVALLSVCAAICLAGIAVGWRIAVNIGRDRSFCLENAKSLGAIAVLSAADGILFFAGNAVYLACGMSHPSLFFRSLLPVFLAAAVSVVAAALSHLVRKAADLQEQDDLTI